MLNIVKLSEKNLFDVLSVLFPGQKVELQKRFDGFVCDYFIQTVYRKFVFEFDDSTHYTDTKTQIRDVFFNGYCRDNNLILIKIPYFLQLDEYTLNHFFDEDIIQEYDLSENIKNINTKSKSGFLGLNIVYPGNFNSFGWVLFWDMCCELSIINKCQILDSFNDKDNWLTLGIDWTETESKVRFYEESICCN